LLTDIINTVVCIYVSVLIDEHQYTDRGGIW
jgi:hypothetical protein